jgi:cytosine/uracil/thiamine/allantoin permease
MPGFAEKIGLQHVADFWARLYDYAWFVSFGISFVSYMALMLLIRPRAIRDDQSAVIAS